ncbi:hypothetical protein RRG08_053108 [Elysia crispata]|uniref:Uncharacterized protein n=1 Tax=Elysia crispata TaxID=231223 RepID=A0AAE0XVT6_9GAST|nr:hypothetical protein RRG08_053108 [Elysia crispata]
MAPPKVNLASKTPTTEPQLDDVPLDEKKDKLDMVPVAVVTVETERRNVQALRARRSQQQCRRLVCGISLLIIMAIATLSTLALVHRLRNRHRQHLECHYGKHRMPEHVNVDHHNHLIYAKHDHDRKTETPALHMLHEYDRRLIAYKDEDKNTCYIDRLDETFEDGYARWLSYEKHGRPEGKMLVRVSEKPIEKEVLMHVGDIHIYAHCENATSFWFMEIHERTESTAMIVHV